MRINQDAGETHIGAAVVRQAHHERRRDLVFPRIGVEVLFLDSSFRWNDGWIRKWFTAPMENTQISVNPEPVEGCASTKMRVEHTSAQGWFDRLTMSGDETWCHRGLE